MTDYGFLAIFKMFPYKPFRDRLLALAYYFVRILRFPLNGMSECYQGAMVNNKVKTLNNCIGFRGIVHRTQNRREFSYNFPGGQLTFYTEFVMPNTYEEHIRKMDVPRTGGFNITRIFMNGKEIDAKEIDGSYVGLPLHHAKRCYVRNYYGEATCNLPDGTWVTYRR